MFTHQPFSIAVMAADPAPLKPLLTYLERTPVTFKETVSDQPDVILAYGPLRAEQWAPLEAYLNSGGHLFFINNPAEPKATLPAFFGAHPCDPIVSAEVRVLPTNPNNPICERLGDAFYLKGLFQPIGFNDQKAETVFYADWRYTHQPVITRKSVGEGSAIFTTLHDWHDLNFQRIVYRLLRSSVHPDRSSKPFGVGLLGYAPSVGQLHGSGAAATSGLTLRTACDLSDERLDAAKHHFPDIVTTKDSNDLINDPDIDVVIIATPPSSHAKLALQMLDGGKHVICEKPLALSTTETDAMISLAEKNGLHLACHQNRRWDSDFLAIQNAVNAGWLGEVFYLETFIGGYGHPCGYWHSHDTISGGTTFDWGAHYLDWMLALMPGEIISVIGSRQNRMWPDITNADQERIQIRYANGAEAEFTHSDLTFIPKPKWYMAGDKGTLVGKWRQVEAYEIDPVIYYHKHEIPPAELGADIELRRITDSGIFTQALPEVKHHPFPFHVNLADHLHLGEPITVPVDHSARVVAILEAAKHSAENGSRIEEVVI
ncbi:MAG: Gfo/Idh/MocA family oxidoreductase [Chloroflexota bacterium]